ncbi:STN and carboxypeptidase regulatory-like domain-containing protein [Telluribacter sp. SYSU D00476]|uniref:STN and carboxypeptidase regulatory-like domain-containing protein n=1 Tax=Telluribacter sp. SYSU D00476 TaxID=2811430 RepID=UPI001FF5D9BE|nr:STN and carboxypeptidase regulatory-like domain-containing protein [Telluribacter sp. SYSU D00476]
MKPVIIHKAFLLVLIFLVSHSLMAQPLLENRISIKVNNERIEEVLRQIGEKGGFSFSYSPDVIDVKARVSVNATNQSIREILNEIFKGSVTFKERRKYIILHKVAAEPERQPDNFFLNGYIIDKKTGERLRDASIYEANSLVSTVSNEYGYYRIKLPTAHPNLRLEVRKEEYSARSIEVTRRQDYYLTISLTPDTIRHIERQNPRILSRHDTVQSRVEPRVEIPRTPQVVSAPVPAAEPDTVAPASRPAYTLKERLQEVGDAFVYAFASTKQAIHTENITDTLYRPFQASILPFIGTNHQLSGNVINDVSLNLIAGYSLGVGALEVGGLVNIVRWDVQGIQVAGLANLVGRDVQGIQIAGFGNLNIGEFRGVQIAGTANATAEDFRGLQISGWANVVGRRLNGWQVTPGLNYARVVEKGHQLGFINYADSSATTPFGYFSYVRQNGYRRYEVSTDELNYFNASFKTGVAGFYNVFTFGMNAFLPGKPLGSIGYGIGTARRLGRGWMLNGDLVASRMAVQRQFWRQPQAGHYRIAVALEKKITPRIALSLGPTLNLLHTPYAGLFDTSPRRGLEPIWIGNKYDDAGITTYGWVGFQAALRFCNRI